MKARLSGELRECRVPKWRLLRYCGARCTVPMSTRLYRFVVRGGCERVRDGAMLQWRHVSEHARRLQVHLQY